MTDEDQYAPMDADEFPGILREIAEIAGVEAALILSRIKGGTLVHFPSTERLRPDHWLVDAVGHEAACKIVNHIATAKLGIRLYVPRGPENDGRLARARTEDRLTRAFFSTATIDGTALALGIDRSTVSRHWRRLRKDGFRRPGLPDDKDVPNDD